MEEGERPDSRRGADRSRTTPVIDGLLDASLLSGPVPVTLYAVAGILTAALLALAIGGPRRLGQRVVGLAAGGVVGLATAWLLGDVLDVWGFAPTAVLRLWVALVGGGIGLAAVVLRQGPGLQRVLAGCVIPLVLVAGGVAINLEFQQFPTFRALFGLTQVAAFAPPTTNAALASVPDAGSVGAVTIPSNVSGFPARPAIVYLPPVALVAQAPALPVLVMLSGQPGSPNDVFTAGTLTPILDGYARQHGGYAPIVVVPDQLTSPSVDPMCVDGALGNSATYLTVDVPAWITSNLHVIAERKAWSIGGFSQGGTCALQLGGTHPELFGNIIDIAGELAPSVGSEQETIDRGFAGNRDAYLSATPEQILRSKSPYADTTAVFAAGSNDTRFLPFARKLEAQAKAAGMKSTLLESPGTAHDWGTVKDAMTKSLPMVMQRAGSGPR